MHTAVHGPELWACLSIEAVLAVAVVIGVVAYIKEALR